MSLGEVNKGMVAFLVLLVLGAGGYLWYSQMYTPAVTARTAAQTAEQTAQDGLSAAKQELAAAQERIEQANDAAKAPDDSVSRLALSRKAIPPDQLIDDAAIVLMDIADRSGVNTSFASPDGSGTSTDMGTASGGAVPIDLTFQAGGTYSEMMLFMSLVEDTVESKNGKLHSRDRLFNVVGLKIGGDEEDGGGAGGFNASEESGPKLERGDMLFTVTVRMYTSSDANNESMAGDPAANPTEGDGTIDGGGVTDDGSGATGDGSTAAGSTAGATSPTGAAAPGTTDTGGATAGTSPAATTPAAGGM